MGQMTTPAERVDDLRARLSGRPPIRKGRSNRSKAAPRADPLFPAALHAASRYSKGLELSLIETRLVDMLKVCASDEEIAEYGKIYTESKTELRSHHTIYDGTCLGLDETTPYDEANMIADAQANASEILSRPEVKILDLSAKNAVNENGCVDDDQYVQAMAEAGCGVTIITGPPSTETIEEVALPTVEGDSDNQNGVTKNGIQSTSTISTASTVSYYRMELQKFKCHRKQTDAVFGPLNEIYWACASGADGRDSAHFRTSVYGSIDSGTERNIGQEYFNGAVQKAWTGHIECWEQDNSPTDFYNRMIQLLRNAASWCIDAAVNAMNAADGSGEVEKGAGFAALIALCWGLVAELLAWLRNDDDLVFSRELGFTKGGLDEWTRRSGKSMSFMFDGGANGKHELWITCSGITVPPGTLYGMRNAGSGWAAPQPAVAGNSMHGMTLADHRGELVGVFRRTDNTMCWTKYNGSAGTWSIPALVAQGTCLTSHRPALCTHNNQLYCMYRGTDGRIWCMSSGDLANWSTPVDAGPNGGRTSDGPAICSFDGYLMSVIRGNDNRLYWNKSTNNGAAWSTYGWFSGNATLGSPSLSVFRNIPHCGIYDINGRLYIGSMEKNGSWNAFLDRGSTLKSGPRLAVLNGRLYITWQGSDNRVNGRECAADGTWGSTYTFTTMYTCGEQGMVAWNGAMWNYHGVGYP
jgi:hypothetical protein